MSDWEDEPKSGRGFGNKPANTAKEVSGWSDDEGNNEKSGGGGTKRFGDGGDRGGYRRGGEGGFRGRQDDENALNLATKLPPIPSSCNEDVVTAFIDRLDLCLDNTTMDEVRELREYLFKAFRHLVSSEWDRLDSLDREEHVQKARKVRKAAAMVDSFIMDVNSLLGETDMRTAQEHNAIDQMKQMGVNWEENVPNLDTQEIVLPQTTSESSRSRRSSNAIRTAEPTPYKVQPIIDIYEKSRRLNEEPQSEFAAREELENYVEVTVSESPQTYGSSKFSQNLSAAVIKSHKLRGGKFRNMVELTSRIAWPIGPLLVWQGYPKFYHKIYYFDEVPMEPSSEPPRTGRRTQDNTSSIQTSRQIEVVRHHRSQNQDMETPDGAYYSRYDATRDEEAAWSATGGGITGVAAEQASSSTPIKRHSELGFSLSSNMNLSIIRGGGAGDPPMPPEFPLSIVDSGTLMMSVDNEETAIVEAVTSSSSEVRSARLGGGTPASTPLYSFRPLLPVINEEHHLYQPVQHQQFVTAIPRMLEMTLSPPTNEATLAEPSAYPPPSGTQHENCAWIFRPRDQIINYTEATPRRPVQRRRRRRRSRILATDANAVETPQERIQVEEQVVSASSQEITKTFMANLIQKAADSVSPSQHKTKALTPAASVTTTPGKSANNPGLDQMKLREIEINHEPSDPSNFKSQTNEESTLPQARCLLEGSTMDTATKEVLLLSPAPAASEKVIETLQDLPGFSDIISNEKITGLDSTIDISNISAINLEQPSFPTIEHMEIDNEVANLSVQAIVTDVQILIGPTTMTCSNLPDDTSNLSKEVVDLSRYVVDSELVELEKSQADNSLYHRESIEDLSYIVQHVDMLRLNIDRQKELSLSRECPEITSDLSMPAVKVYDPKIVVNMPQAKIRLIHKVLGALVMQPQVDMRSADFIQNRIDAAVTFRLLLDLKAANIINLSKDGQIFSLK